MSTNADQEVLVGLTGDGTAVRGVRVFTVTTTVQEIEIEELTATNPTSAAGASAVWLTIMGDNPFNLIAGTFGAITDPDAAARVASTPDAMCLQIPAFFPYTRKFTKTRATGIKVSAVNLDVRLQIERTSPIIGGSMVGA